MKDKLRTDQVVLAHAGIGIDVANTTIMPNSLAAIKQTIEVYELDGVEVDIQFSKDHKCFVYHDKYLQEQTTSSGTIYDQNSAQLQDVYWKGLEKNEDSRLLPIEKLFELLSGEYYPKRVSLNIKDYDPWPDYQANYTYLDSLLKVHQLYDQIYIESDNVRTLDELLKVNAALPCLYVRNINEENYRFVMQKGYSGIVDHLDDAQIEWMDSLQKKNKLAVIYGQLTHKDFQSNTTLKADVIQVDNPVLARKSR